MSKAKGNDKDQKQTIEQQIEQMRLQEEQNKGSSNLLAISAADLPSDDDDEPSTTTSKPATHKSSRASTTEKELPHTITANKVGKTKITKEFIAKLEKEYKGEDDGTELGLPGVIRHKNGGLQFNDKEEMKAQSGVVKELLSSLGANLLQGKSVINITLPVRIFEPRSFLQRIPDAWGFAPIFLNKAALATDPVERFKWTITFVLSGLHRGTQQRKPFNPILGETFQAGFADGTEIYLEQISHHPPVSAFQVFGPDNLYHLWGYHDFRASFRPNSIVGGQVGPNHVDFADGTRITYHMPTVVLGGIIWGDRIFQWSGSIPFEDKKNCLKAELVFNPDEKKGLTKYVGYLPTFGMFGSAAAPVTTCDNVRGEIAIYSSKNGREETKVVSRIEGSWIDNLTFDGQVYWTNKQFKPFLPIPVAVEQALPSDCNLREDLMALKKKDEDSSQTLKTQLEERQRYDGNLRKKWKEENPE